ncbi:VWA domain-containing protein [Nocardia huaxiensis]|uniref:VWA domain-containing protein n=1 Tax=Nocardia huaxiensis TaxID=2755382 RepID=UPI001E356F59|nr:VWA domain-containing protein [Nocardia huaxiensis]UFS96402.1 VWA domain-containing protein [Nocardia huaxiensis]
MASLLNRRTKVLVAAILTLCGVMVAGCGTERKSGPIVDYDSNANVLNIVAGSEHDAVFQEIVQPWCTSEKLTCSMTKMGSVDQARLLQSGETPPYDAFWFASSVFQQLGDAGHQLQAVQPMFSTPLVYAGRKAEFDALGFTGREVGIEEILAAVESKKTTAWMTNPTQSNSGATVLLGFLNYFAGNGPGVALTREQLDSEPVKTGITRFARAFARTPPSTGLLMDECLAAQDCKTLFTYEDLVIERNKELVRQGQEPLQVVYPKGVLAISDAPLGFLPHGDNPGKRQNFEKLQSFLLSAQTQQNLTELGRRPITSIGLSLPDAPKDVFNSTWGIQANLAGQPITYPAAAVIEAALDNYQTVYRTPTDLVYCIDASGSMDGNGGWKGVQRAADLLFDPVESKKYLLQTGPKDRTAVLVFDTTTQSKPWTEGNSAGSLNALHNTIRDAGPSGNTGIYRCLSKAAQQFSGAADPARKRLVILMTDGADTEGGDGLDEIARTGVPVVAIGFGEGVKDAALQEIARRTGGSFLHSDDMVAALRQATGYR